jgi:rhodanese-related sulfurtransferase
MNEGGAGMTVKELVARARERIENVSVQDAAKEFEAGKAVIVDLREPGERTQNGSIPGAVHAPRGMLEFYADPTSPYHMDAFDPESRIILHCAAGGRSALAVDTLRHMGFKNVANLDGGFTAWKEAGQPVEKT